MITKKLTTALTTAFLCLTAIGPGALAQSSCQPDGNGRYSAACVREIQQLAWRKGVRETCEGLGGRYELRAGQPRCHPPQVAFQERGPDRDGPPSSKR